METLFTISTAHGGQYFSLFYTIAFLFVIGFFIIAGFRSKYPKLLWLLITFSGVFFFILGNKLFACTPDEWLQIFTKFQFPETTGKTILGGIIGLIFGIFLATKLLNFRKPVFDKLAIALPIAMAIQRVGCLLAGCCFGTPTDMPWAIKYGAGFMAYKTHLHDGHIHLNDHLSLAVHPTQLYQIIGCLMIAFIVWRMRRYWKASGNLFLFSVVLYTCFRFFIEFLYDPVANGEAGIIVWGLKYVQWAVAASVLLIGFIIYIREKRYNALNSDYIFSNKHLLRATALTIFFILISGIFSMWFDMIEKLIIYVILIPTVILLFINMFRCLTSPNLRWMTGMLIFCSLVFSSQSYTTYKTKTKKTTYMEVSSGGSNGVFYKILDHYATIKHAAIYDCSGHVIKPAYVQRVGGPPKLIKHNFTTFGIEFSYNEIIEKKNNKKKKYRFGLGLSRGVEQETTKDSSSYTKSHMINSINPSIQCDWGWLGLRVGMHIGRLRLTNFSKEVLGNEKNNELISFKTYPDIAIRLGPKDALYLKWHWSSHFPSSSPLLMHKFGIGTDFKKFDCSTAEIGWSNAGVYLQTSILIKERVMIEVFYADRLKSNHELNSIPYRLNPSGDLPRRMASLSLRYRFNFK